MKVRSDKAKAVKVKTIAKNKVKKAAEVAKKRALVQKLKDSAQKEQARKNALKAREQVKLLKLKESKKREVEKARAKKSKLIDSSKWKACYPRNQETWASKVLLTMVASFTLGKAGK